MRVLVVDDSAEMRAFFVLALEAAGYEVIEAGNADRAFELARAKAPDLVITDIMMDGPTGLDLISRIRGDIPPPPPPIIACSGLTELEGEALRRGAVLFLAKPFIAADLIAVVAEVLSRRAGAACAVAARRSRWLRSHLVENAAAALGASAGPAGELARRADWTVDWISAYFGFGCAAVLFVTDGDLRVVSSSDQAMLPSGAPLNGQLPLARDVLEGGSTVLFGDVSAYLPPAAPVPSPVRFFAGVPLFAPNHAAIGALCFFDTRPQRLEADDLGVLEHLGRVGTRAIASIVDGRAYPHFLAGPMMLSRASFEKMLGLELHRARRHQLAVELVIAKLGQVLPATAYRDAVTAVMRPQRSGMAAFAPDQLAIYVARPEAAAASRELAAAVEALRGLAGVRAAGAISIQGDAVPNIDERDLISIAGTLAEHDDPGAPRGGVERIVMRRAPWA